MQLPPSPLSHRIDRAREFDLYFKVILFNLSNVTAEFVAARQSTSQVPPDNLKASPPAVAGNAKGVNPHRSRAVGMA